MHFNQYQDEAGAFCRTPVDCSFLGLAGEAGEVVELFKKARYHGAGMDLDKLAKELGDCLWYLSDIARQYRIPLNAVALGNLEKLAKRYPKGHFTVEDSLARVDTVEPGKYYGVDGAGI